MRYFPVFTEFPTTSFQISTREGTQLAFSRGSYLTKKWIFLQATVFLLYRGLIDHIALANGVNNIHTLGYFAEDCVFSVQMRLR